MMTTINVHSCIDKKGLFNIQNIKTNENDTIQAYHAIFELHEKKFFESSIFFCVFTLIMMLLLFLAYNGNL